MKSFLNHAARIIFFVFAGLQANAQESQSFSYQGLIRAKDNRPVSNSIISLRISILKEFDEGDIVFQEEHKIRTDSFGIFSIQIGEGKKVQGSLAEIDWSAHLFYLRTEADVNGGSDYMEIGVTQFRSVPMALYATRAGGNLWKQDSSQIVPSVKNSGITLIKSDSQDQDMVTVDREQDKYGRILTYTQDGSVLAEISQLDSSGFIGTVGASDGSYRTLMYNDKQTDAGIFAILNKTWDLVTLQSNDGLSGSIYVSQELENGELGPKMVLTSRPTEKETGIYIFNDKSSYFGDEPPVPHAELKVNNKFNAGELLLKGKNGSANVVLGSAALNPNYGYLSINDSIGNSGVKLDIMNDGGQISIFQKGRRMHYSGRGSADQGINNTYGPNGNATTSIGSNSVYPNSGSVTLYNENSRTRMIHTVLSDAGYSSYYGPKGNSIITLSALGGAPNNGLIAVQDDSRKSKAFMYVDALGNGNVGANYMQADLYKSYTIYPKDSNLYISNTVLQGTEAATYIRGTAQLINGNANIILPDHFSQTVSSSKITVMLTPLSADSKGIAVLNKTASGFVAQELFAGSGNYEFDYEVKGIRKGYENEPVIVNFNQGNTTSFLKSHEGVEKMKELEPLPHETKQQKEMTGMNKSIQHTRSAYNDLLQRPTSLLKNKQNIITSKKHSNE